MSYRLENLEDKFNFIKWVKVKNNNAFVGRYFRGAFEISPSPAGGFNARYSRKGWEPILTEGHPSPSPVEAVKLLLPAVTEKLEQEFWHNEEMLKGVKKILEESNV